MRERFRNKIGLSKFNLVKLRAVNQIVDEYAAQGYRLTLRQLYYQLVSRNLIPNKQSEYAKLSTLLVKGRMAGEVDWNAIEDRLRVPRIPYWVNDVPDALQDTIRQYRLNRQAGQSAYIELWVEKDALSEVLQRITSHYHIRLMVNRGYSSCSAMYQAAERFRGASQFSSSLHILYLGDHDPSGLDMIRDIESRLFEFGVCLDVLHIGLTQQQIKAFDPPPNPTKITDPRAKRYLAEYGDTCWEVDALRPDVLSELVSGAIELLIDVDLFEAQIKREDRDKARLKQIIGKVE